VPGKSVCVMSTWYPRYSTDIPCCIFFRLVMSAERQP
jgi:hypothetical protein